MTVFQIISALFALFMMYVINIHRKKKNLTKVEAWAWYATWGLFIFIALFPHFLLGITGFLHFARVFDLLIVIAFMILSVVVFMSYFKVKSLEKRVERFVRTQAIEQAAKKNR